MQGTSIKCIIILVTLAVVIAAAAAAAVVAEKVQRLCPKYLHLVQVFQLCFQVQQAEVTSPIHHHFL